MASVSRKRGWMGTTTRKPSTRASLADARVGDELPVEARHGGIVRGRKIGAERRRGALRIAAPRGGEAQVPVERGTPFACAESLFVGEHGGAEVPAVGEQVPEIGARASPVGTQEE